MMDIDKIGMMKNQSRLNIEFNPEEQKALNTYIERYGLDGRRYFSCAYLTKSVRDDIIDTFNKTGKICDEAVFDLYYSSCIDHEHQYLKCDYFDLGKNEHKTIRTQATKRFDMKYQKKMMSRLYYINDYVKENLAHVKCNLITLTTYHDGPVYEQLQVLQIALTRTLKTLQNSYGPQPYFYVWEPHTASGDGYAHVHLVYFHYVTEDIQMVLHQRWHYKWEFGGVDINSKYFTKVGINFGSYCEMFNARAYLSKYLSKFVLNQDADNFVDPYSPNVNNRAIARFMANMTFCGLRRVVGNDLEHPIRKLHMFGCSRDISHYCIEREEEYAYEHSKDSSLLLLHYSLMSEEFEHNSGHVIREGYIKQNIDLLIKMGLIKDSPEKRFTEWGIEFYEDYHSWLMRETIDYYSHPCEVISDVINEMNEFDEFVGFEHYM